MGENIPVDQGYTAHLVGSEEVLDRSSLSGADFLHYVYGGIGFSDPFCVSTTDRHE